MMMICIYSYTTTVRKEKSNKNREIDQAERTFAKVAPGDNIGLKKFLPWTYTMT